MKQLINICLVAFLGLPVNSAFRANTCSTAKSSVVVKSLNESVDLNERFKSAIQTSQSGGAKSLRAEVERQEETILVPCVKRAVRLLIHSNDPALAMSLLKAVSSYSNSADEQIADAFGELFAKNPEVVERTIDSFDSPSRKLILDSLVFGWETAKKSLPMDIRQDRDRRLKTLSTT